MRAVVYVRLFREFLRACFVEEAEYRLNFVGHLLLTGLHLAVAVLMVNLFFFRTESIGGWSFYEVLLLLGVFNAVHGFIEMFLQPNMSRLVQHIRKGTLDYVLLKPVDSQFYVSLRHMVFWKAADIALGLGLVGYSLAHVPAPPAGGQWLLFGVMLTVAFCIVYSIWMMMMICSFWAVKVDNLSYLFMSVFDTARFPLTVYKGALRLLLMYVFPIGFITTFPAGALTGHLQPQQVVIALGLAVVFLLVTRRLWRLAIRSYTSASS
jgi:ABC-2 type transport system permease protein